MANAQPQPKLELDPLYQRDYCAFKVELADQQAKLGPNGPDLAHLAALRRCERRLALATARLAHLAPILGEFRTLVESRRAAGL